MTVFEKEAAQQSAHSPGIVTDDEPLLLALVFPHNFDGSAAILRHDDLKDPTRGMSVVRTWYATADTVQREVFDSLLSKEGRSAVGAVVVICNEVRAVRIERRGTAHRHFCVIDDGLPNNPGHALIFYAALDKFAQNDRASARLLLSDLINRTPPRNLDSIIFGRVES